jgi:hypothetical protein
MNEIDNVVKEISELTDTEKIILISRKINVSGELQSFKLCVILNTESVAETEEKLYTKIDCEVSFDLVLYKKEEWEDLSDDVGSFAWKIAGTGAVLFEKGGAL